jgi:hypothetical protein
MFVDRNCFATLWSRTFRCLSLLLWANEPAFVPEFLPCPHLVGGQFRQWESQLVRQHADLSTVMGIVRDHIRKHCRSCGPRSGPTIAPELADTAVWPERFAKHLCAAQGTFCQCDSCLLLGTAGAVELCRQLEMWGGEPEPLAANVVHVREYRGNCAHIAPESLCPPSLRMEVLENELIHLVVDDVAFRERSEKLSVR